MTSPTTAWRWLFSLAPVKAQAGTPPPDAASADVRVWFSGALFERPAALARVPPEASDADFVLAGYRAQHSRVFAGLRGSFAVAILDADRGLVLVARDHVGLHPVFYRLHRGLVAFSPATAALAAWPGPPGLPAAPCAFNRPAMVDAICRRFPNLDETLFTDVKRLPGGAVATVDRGQVRVDRYWEPIPVDGTFAATATDLEAVEDARRRAIRRATGFGRVAILLSGGIDSVSIAASAADDAREAGVPLPLALSLGIPGAADERPVQRAVAASLGLPHRLVDFHLAVGPKSLVAQALSIGRSLSSPLASLWEPPYVALARTARALGRTTILTGTGGDEFFSSSPFVAADYLRRGDVIGARRFIRTYERSQRVRGAWWRMAIRPLVAAAAARVRPDVLERRRGRRLVASDPTWIAPDASLRGEYERRAFTTKSTASWPLGFAHADVRSMTLDHPFTSIELEEHFELGQQCGVTYRHPYLDPDLIDVLCRTAPSVLNQGGWLKGMLRTPLAARFPGCGFDVQPKSLVDEFYRTTLLADGVAEHRIRTGFPALASLGILEGSPATVTALSWAGSARSFSRVWPLLSLESWVDARQRERHAFVHSEGAGIAS